MIAQRATRKGEQSARLLDEGSTVFAVEEVAHGFAACGSDFKLGAAFGVVGGGAHLRLGGFFRLAARGAAIRKSRLAGAKLELLVTNYAGFDREGHARIC